jgi:hypothetical protein
MSKLFFGIDPGKNGGIACIDHTGQLIYAVKMPDTDLGVLNALDAAVQNSRSIVVCLIEKVNLGFAGSSKSSIAKLYGNYCALKMACAASEISVKSINSKKWERLCNISSSGSSKKERKAHKEKLLERARSLFPSEKITLKTCDAVLLAHLCYRSRT